MGVQLFNHYPAKIGDHAPGTWKTYDEAELQKTTIKNFMQPMPEGDRDAGTVFLSPVGKRGATSPDEQEARRQAHAKLPALPTLKDLSEERQLSTIKDTTDMDALKRWEGERHSETVASAIRGQIKLVGGETPKRVR